MQVNDFLLRGVSVFPPRSTFTNTHSTPTILIFHAPYSFTHSFLITPLELYSLHTNYSYSYFPHFQLTHALSPTHFTLTTYFPSHSLLTHSFLLTSIHLKTLSHTFPHFLLAHLPLLIPLSLLTFIHTPYSLTHALIYLLSVHSTHSLTN